MSQVFLTLITAYAIWQWVYQPWKVVRRDQAALTSQLAELKTELALRKAINPVDMDAARGEIRTALAMAARNLG